MLGLLGAVGGLFGGAIAQSQSASNAADAQTQAAQAGIAEQSRQFDLVQELLSPYVQGGTDAFGAQGDLLGLNGPDAQRAAISALENSAQFQTLMQQGEEAILQNASATGGVRGGNTQSALMQYRPQVLSQMINNQFSNLGSMAGMGQASAAGVGAAAQNTGNQIAALHGQIGQAQAGNALAQGQAVSNAFGTIGNLAMLGLGGF